MEIYNNFPTLFLIAFVLIIVSSCTRVHPKTVEQKGFVDDFSMLEADKDGIGVLFYVNKDVDFTKYDKIWLETVIAFVYEGSRMEDIPEEEINELLDYIKKTFIRVFSEDYEFVNKPGPGTMQVRIGITDLSGQNRLTNTLSTFVPQARALSELKRLATGRHIGTGGAAYEAEVLDSLTGEKLIVEMGAKTGGKPLGGSITDRFRDFRAAVDVWTENAKLRLRKLREESSMKKSNSGY